MNKEFIRRVASRVVSVLAGVLAGYGISAELAYDVVVGLLSVAAIIIEMVLTGKGKKK